MVGRKGNIQARRATCIYARGRHRVWSILATTDMNKTILWGVLNRQKNWYIVLCQDDFQLAFKFCKCDYIQQAPREGHNLPA